ncbi:MAG: hypothetical protein WC652_07190, partial [archaeon]
YSLVKNWRKRIAQVQRDPHSVLVIVGPQEMERKKEREFFFTTNFSKQALASFTPEYQEFIRSAKKALGARLIFINHTVENNFSYLYKLMLARKLIPAQHMLLSAYGEYLGVTKPQCVDNEFRLFSEFIKHFQSIVWKEKPHSLRGRKLDSLNGKKTTLSLKHCDLDVWETNRELKAKGKITPEFVRQKFNIPKRYPIVRTAKIINHAFAVVERKKKRLALKTRRH